MHRPTLPGAKSRSEPDEPTAPGGIDPHGKMAPVGNPDRTAGHRQRAFVLGVELADRVRDVRSWLYGHDARYHIESGHRLRIDGLALLLQPQRVRRARVR